MTDFETSQSALHNPDLDLDWFLQKTIDMMSVWAQTNDRTSRDQYNRLLAGAVLLAKPFDELSGEERSQLNNFMSNNFLSVVHARDIKETGKSGGVNFERYMRVYYKLTGLPQPLK